MSTSSAGDAAAGPAKSASAKSGSRPESSRDQLISLLEPWGCNCECVKCETASGPGPDLPCWFLTNDCTAMVLWEAYRNMTIDPDHVYKSLAMQLFNKLVKNKVILTNVSCVFELGQRMSLNIARATSWNEKSFTQQNTL
jgi:hypothetical protein